MSGRIGAGGGVEMADAGGVWISLMLVNSLARRGNAVVL
jgi:hypothetical protein